MKLTDERLEKLAKIEGGWYAWAKSTIDALLAEVHRLKPDAAVGAAAQKLPWNSGIQRGGVDGQIQWMITQGGAYFGWFSTLEEALADAGLMGEGGTIVSLQETIRDLQAESACLRPDVVESIVQAMVRDVSSRWGLGQDWEHIEQDVMNEELLPEWRRIIAAQLITAGLLGTGPPGKRDRDNPLAEADEAIRKYAQEGT